MPSFRKGKIQIKLSYILRFVHYQVNLLLTTKPEESVIIYTSRTDNLKKLPRY